MGGSAGDRLGLKSGFGWFIESHKNLGGGEWRMLRLRFCVVLLRYMYTYRGVIRARVILQDTRFMRESRHLCGAAVFVAMVIFFISRHTAPNIRIPVKGIGIHIGRLLKMDLTWISQWLLINAYNRCLTLFCL